MQFDEWSKSVLELDPESLKDMFVSLCERYEGLSDNLAETGRRMAFVRNMMTDMEVGDE
jgi:hypothetical protein